MTTMNCLALLLLLSSLLAPPRLATQEVPPTPPPAAREANSLPDELPPPHMAPELHEFLERLKEENPEEFKRLEELRRKDRRAFREELARKLPRKPWEMMDRRQLELDRECWELARKVRECQDPQEAQRLQAQLKAKVEETVDLLVNQTRKRLEEMNKRLQAIEENRDNILEKKMDFYLHAPFPQHIAPGRERRPPRPAPEGRRPHRQPPQENPQGEMPPPPPGTACVK